MIAEDIRLAQAISRHAELQLIIQELSITTFRYVPRDLREKLGESEVEAHIGHSSGGADITASLGHTPRDFSTKFTRRCTGVGSTPAMNHTRYICTVLITGWMLSGVTAEMGRKSGRDFATGRPRNPALLTSECWN